MMLVQVESDIMKEARCEDEVTYTRELQLKAEC